MARFRIVAHLGDANSVEIAAEYTAVLRRVASVELRLLAEACRALAREIDRLGEELREEPEPDPSLEVAAKDLHARLGGIGPHERHEGVPMLGASDDEERSDQRRSLQRSWPEPIRRTRKVARREVVEETSVRLWTRVSEGTPGPFSFTVVSTKRPSS